MKTVEKSAGNHKEIEWWDHWNRSHRTVAFAEDCDEARTGRMGFEEVVGLGLARPGILEVGCGTGWLASQLAALGDYVGLDLSPAAIEVAREKVPGGRFEAADFHDWDSGGETFDVIVMIDTIAYFRDQEAALRRARAMLRPGGFLVLTTVNPFVYSRMSWVGAPGEGQVRKWLTKRALHGMLENNGFSVRTSKTAFPAGDRGILRLVNSRVLNGIVTRLIPQEWVRRGKEKLGLGRYRVVVARRVESEAQEK